LDEEDMILKRLQMKLKEVARGQGKSYADMALKLEVSEATVKRVMNHEDVSFSRLEQLCDVLEVSLYDIVDLSKNQGQKLYQYTKEQEQFLSKDKLVFLVFRYLIMGKALSEIGQRLMMPEEKLRTILKDMEEIKLIERHPSDRIKLLANFPFKWIPDGPLEKTFGPDLLDRVVKESLQIGINQFTDESACLVFEWGISPQSHKLFVKELGQVYEKYKKVAQVEIKSLGDDFVPTSGMISISKYPMW
jgi:DNA-binding Xre family transcriptional regulator